MSTAVDSAAPRAWVLNFDAELELEARGRYAPSARIRAIVGAQVERLRKAPVGPEDTVGPEGIVGPEDVVVLEGAPPDPRAAGRPGLAWCPTPRARALLEAAGAEPVAAPSVDVLRAVNARSFARDVRAALLEEQLSAAFAKHVARDLDEALRLIAQPAERGWLVRRPFGAAGRGRRRLYAGTPGDEERAWLVASLRLGPLVVEPFVAVTCEFTRSGLVRPDGTVHVAGPGFQATTDAGAWMRTRVARRDEVGRPQDAALEAACYAAGSALARAGYFGAFGVDAFRYRDGTREVLNPLSEINARLTMDWSQTMGGPERLLRGPV